MVSPLLISIDFDDTFTADVEMWSRVIAEFQRSGHRVICVSARPDSDSHKRELSRALPNGVDVLLSCFEPKRAFALKQGYAVDIWIDDIPEAIPTKEEMLHHCS